MRSKEEIEQLLKWSGGALRRATDPAYAILIRTYVQVLQWVLGHSSPTVEQIVEGCQNIDAEVEKAKAARLN